MEPIIVSHIDGPVVENLLMAFRVASFQSWPAKCLVRRSSILPTETQVFRRLRSRCSLFLCVTDEDELDHASLFTSVKS